MRDHSSKIRISLRWITLAVVMIGLASSAEAQFDPPSAVPTFHSIGLYWRPIQGNENVPCQVEYREAGSGDAWRRGHDLWFDYRTGIPGQTEEPVPPIERQREYRGSIVGLDPGSEYEIKMTLVGPGITHTLIKQTWSEDFLIDPAETVYLPAYSNQPLVITEGGAPGAYKLYCANGLTGESVIDLYGTFDNVEGQYCIAVQAPYVIIRGITMRGGEHGVFIDDEVWPNTYDVHDVVIEECDISGWGTRCELSGFGDAGSAIFVDDGWIPGDERYDYGGADHRIERLVIQRNLIHDPRWDSNNWGEWNTCAGDSGSYHPWGPLPISLRNTAGNHVIRYNEITTDDEHRFDDIIGGGSNFSYYGSPGRDSDIYQNWLDHCWDDALEIEGGGSNVRVWGNYIDDTYVKIACVANSIGPLYIFRNISATSRASHGSWPGNLPDENGGKFLKMGRKTDEVSGYFGDGQIYIFHNTLLQPHYDFNPDADYGCTSGIGRQATLNNVKTRNNIVGMRTSLATSKFSLVDTNEGPTNNFDYDIMNGWVLVAPGQEAHGFYYNWDASKYEPTYHPDNYDPLLGDGIPGQFYIIAADDPEHDGYDDGEAVPNFSNGFTGMAPDMGAHEYLHAPMTFGVDAVPPVLPFYQTISLRNGVDGYAGNEDSRITEINPADPKGNKKSSYIYKRYDSYGTRYQLLQRFDVSAIPAGVTVTSATFELTNSVDAHGASTIFLHAMQHDWNEAWVTWERFDAGRDDTWYPPAETDLPDPVATWTEATPPLAGDVMQLDVTTLVQSWVDDPALAGYGFVVIDQSEEFHEVHTSEALEITVRPQLTVVYEATAGRAPVAQPDERAAGATARSGSVVAATRIESLHPNPFNPMTTIDFSIGAADVDATGSARVKLEVFDVRGRRVEILADETLAAGDHSRVWQGTSRGRRAASGIYFCRLSVGERSFTRKMILAK